MCIRDRCIGAKVNMGKPVLTCQDIPCTYAKEKMIDEPVEIGGREYRLTTISMGNPCLLYTSYIARFLYFFSGRRFGW